MIKDCTQSSEKRITMSVGGKGIVTEARMSTQNITESLVPQGISQTEKHSIRLVNIGFHDTIKIPCLIVTNLVAPIRAPLGKVSPV